MKKAFALALTILCFQFLSAQPDRWQQRVKYTMDVKMDVSTNRLTGTQKLEYTNNSPDTLHKVFYHLYFNAFQPNSMMDTRSRWFEKADQDSRVRDRILNLTPEEIGYQKISSLKMNGVVQSFDMKETILEVKLSKPILPHSKVVFDMEFNAQVPLQVRRSGRDNPTTGVRYSMSQWYPKLCEYDYEGWHPTPYIAREFYGVWGDYDVKITIDKKYMIGGTGYLVNANEIGYGFEAPGTKVPIHKGATLTWNFTAPNVHDFMWAADPEFRHLTRKAVHGTTINVFYNRDMVQWQKQYSNLAATVRARYANFDAYAKSIDDQWTTVADAAVIVLPFIEKHFG
ncbi:MAG: M1 family peptidase, partial [Chitinophagaceae bacterium]